MTLTRFRVLQYIALIVIFALCGGAYWYFFVRASVVLNKSGVSGTTKVNTSQNSSVTNGLVGEWSFNGADISGTTAYDRSGQGNDGTLVNGPTKTQGRIGQGLATSPAIGGYMNAGSGASLDDLSTRTITAWIKPTTAGGGDYGRIVNKTKWFFYTCANTFIGCSSTNNKLVFAQDFFTTSGTWRSVNNITLGVWQHVAITYDSSSTSNDPVFYINGVLAGTYEYQAPVGTPAATDAAEPLYVGNNVALTRSFDGILDEVRVYNRILSAEEIQSLYALGDPDKVNTSVSTPQGTGRLDSGLQSYWSLDENTGTQSTDASTNGKQGTLTNGPTWATGQINYGVDFDGTDDYVTTTDAAELDVVDSVHFTISGWFNRDTATTDDTIVAKSNGQTATDTGYVVYVDDATDKITFNASDGTDRYQLESVSTFTATGWHHFAVVWSDSASSETKLYIDGMAESATATGTFANVNSLANALAFVLGAESDAGNPFDGKLDEIRLYNRALSADEVAQLYRLAVPTGVDTGLKGYWSFNGQDISGTTAYDRSGAGNTGTLTNSPTTTPGKLGQALSFEGSTDYVSVSDASSLDITGTLTLSAWVRNASHLAAGNYRCIINKGTVGSAQHNYNFCLYGSGGTADIVVFRFYNTGWRAVWGTTTSLDLNAWYHVVAVYNDTANTIDLYVNGVAQSETISGDPENQSLIANNQNLTIGDIDGTVYYPFNGRIDEVRIYNRALSASEITALYNQGR